MARITEVKTIKIRSVNCSNALALQWGFTGGGWGFWVFEHRQIFDLQGDAPRLYEVDVPMLSTATGNKAILQQGARESVTVYAEQLELQEVIGLRTILTSRKVYEIDQAGNRKDVIVRGVNNSYPNDAGMYSVSVEFERPELYL